MNRILVAGALLPCLLLVACAGASLRVDRPYQPSPGQKFTYEIVNKAQVPAEGLGILEARLATQLTGSGLLTSRTDKSARTVEIVIENYYMRHGATRAMVGVMAGADNILSTVIVKEAGSGEVLARFQVQSSNPTALGTSRGLIEEHADKIVNYLKSGQQS